MNPLVELMLSIHKMGNEALERAEADIEASIKILQNIGGK